MTCSFLLRLPPFVVFRRVHMLSLDLGETLGKEPRFE